MLSSSSMLVLDIRKALHGLKNEERFLLSRLQKFAIIELFDFCIIR